ncbi:MAG: hypothetical protein Gaeavirus12_6 [Gaeavirus sp.]|uniref:Uncharacterized protein n=1 Tax=Gaeavirus sp. TaxID=2487767 RepID=A0A3G4ZZ14_9VIRU|nr:MAG: hypothetical protein Gaeavirus12_6 [Gaeavirus sp.]
MNNFSDFNNYNSGPNNMNNLMNNQNMNNNNNNNNNNIENMNTTNDNFMNMARSIDTISLDNLNGTNISDLNNNNTYAQPQNNYALQNPNHDPQQNKGLIKVITKELINGLKENNLSLHDDNTSNYSSSSRTRTRTRKHKIGKKFKNPETLQDFTTDADDHELELELKDINYKGTLKKGVEHMMSENNIPESNTISSYLFDNSFNIRDFVLLFGLYFMLSQEMIKDFFGQYFTSLNPDDTGKVNVKGVIIYGLILTVAYMVLKKFI